MTFWSQCDNVTIKYTINKQKNPQIKRKDDCSSLCTRDDKMQETLNASLVLILLTRHKNDQPSYGPVYILNSGIMRDELHCHRASSLIELKGLGTF